MLQESNRITVESNWKWPDIPGLHDFKGPTVHTANWPQEVDLKNKTVAIIGNGSTGIQLLAEVYKGRLCEHP